jgi:hypothetical protein
MGSSSLAALYCFCGYALEEMACCIFEILARRLLLPLPPMILCSAWRLLLPALLEILRRCALPFGAARQHLGRFTWSWRYSGRWMIYGLWAFGLFGIFGPCGIFD